MRPKDPAYLRHILDAIDSIEDFSEGISLAAAEVCRRLERAGIERMLTIIGEAAKNISPQMRRKHPEIPWKYQQTFRLPEADLNATIPSFEVALQIPVRKLNSPLPIAGSARPPAGKE